MKRLLTICMIFLAVVAVEAQTVAVVDFMKVPANGGDAYLAVEKQWKTLASEQGRSRRQLLPGKSFM